MIWSVYIMDGNFRSVKLTLGAVMDDETKFLVQTENMKDDEGYIVSVSNSDLATALIGALRNS
jgi:hypothetical protein